MLRVPTTRCLRWLSASALALVVHAYRPGEALASCGDWLDGRGHDMSAADVAEMASDELATALSDWNELREATSFPEHPVEGPQPCQGPGCRRAPQAPPPTAPPRTPTDGQERWFTLAGPPLMAPIGARRLAVEGTLELSAGFRPRVERPPRV